MYNDNIQFHMIWFTPCQRREVQEREREREEEGEERDVRPHRQHRPRTMETHRRTGGPFGPFMGSMLDWFLAFEV